MLCSDDIRVLLLSTWWNKLLQLQQIRSSCDVQVFGELLVNTCTPFPFLVCNPLYLTRFEAVLLSNQKDCLLG